MQGAKNDNSAWEIQNMTEKAEWRTDLTIIEPVTLFLRISLTNQIFTYLNHQDNYIHQVEHKINDSKDYECPEVHISLKSDIIIETWQDGVPECDTPTEHHRCQHVPILKRQLYIKFYCICIPINSLDGLVVVYLFFFTMLPTHKIG